MSASAATAAASAPSYAERIAERVQATEEQVWNLMRQAEHAHQRLRGGGDSQGGGFRCTMLNIPKDFKLDKLKQTCRKIRC